MYREREIIRIAKLFMINNINHCCRIIWHFKKIQKVENHHFNSYDIHLDYLIIRIRIDSKE